MPEEQLRAGKTYVQEPQVCVNILSQGKMQEGFLQASVVQHAVSSPGTACQSREGFFCRAQSQRSKRTQLANFPQQCRQCTRHTLHRRMVR